MGALTDLVDPSKSPLSRIMTLFNADEPARRKFENNICATHVGNGLVISVAHHLFGQVPIFRCIPESLLTTEILPKLSASEQGLLRAKYNFDAGTMKWYFAGGDADIPHIQQLMNKCNLDMRYLGLFAKKVATPCLVFNFNEKRFFDGSQDMLFDPTNYLYEAPLEKHTFLIELELLWQDFKNDISMYRFKPKYMPLATLVPSIDIDYRVCQEDSEKLHCLQGAPSDNLGRMINRAIIEGYIDQFSNLGLYGGRMYYFEGFRYLIKGYFRFGSSGAPYVFFDEDQNRFMMNAIQSEACPQQLLIGNSREGHAQYINAIASPLLNAKELIEAAKT